MRDSGIRDLHTAAAAEAELKALRGNGTRQRKPREVPIGGRGASKTAAPIDVSAFSQELELLAQWNRELAAAHRSAGPAGGQDLHEVCGCRQERSMYLAIARHLDEIPDEQYRQVIGIVRDHVGHYAAALSAIHEVPRFYCPYPHGPGPDLDRAARKRIEQGILDRNGNVVEPPLTKAGKIDVQFAISGLTGPTVIAEYVLPGGREGALRCYDRACLQPDGSRRRLSLAEVLPHGEEELLTLKQLSLLWGIREGTLYQALIGTRAAVRIEHRDAKDNQPGKPRLYRVGDILAHPWVIKRLSSAD